jgi:transcription factor STE12
MMNMNVDAQNPASSSSSIFTDPMFRTGSPASFHQTDSPAPFNVDLPLQYPGTAGYIPQTQQHQQQQQQQQILHSATMPVTGQYGAGQQQPQYDGYYVQQPHATL